jgi:hypothetical protein
MDPLYGKFTCGFYNRLGSDSVVWSELRVLCIEIDIGSQLNIKKVSFEMDSLVVVVNMVNSSSTPKAFLQPLLHRPRWATSFFHVYREANRYADLLSKSQTLFFEFNCNFLDVSPFTLKLLLKDDVKWISLPRFI